MTDIAKFTDGQVQVLKTLMGMIIPASEEHAVPGADDDLIFADVLAAAAERHDQITDMLTNLDNLTRHYQGAEFTRLPAARQNEVIPVFRECHAAAAELLETLAAQCYYRDDRIMQSLGLELRAPFPQGYEVDQGDWSLLDPVRDLPAIYKSAL